MALVVFCPSGLTLRLCGVEAMLSHSNRHQWNSGTVEQEGPVSQLVKMVAACLWGGVGGLDWFVPSTNRALLPPVACYSFIVVVIGYFGHSGSENIIRKGKNKQVRNASVETHQDRVIHGSRYRCPPSTSDVSLHM
ncbi:predicted protein [Histoplasma capsulatum G186AR]|uniref:Uncharacterized protein n=1 Tax=Ajellomyces capsulatus (strain G186AR / H82 / ATCC MYA-2454 / RMSCC 2432) TaxID=447093 RepID=C0NZR8_AJECG|nr:uncharacterized protein HCBG_08648 [Histoplasma capsulatum G186AR]EEH03008.1 predicted protein [Histoplasma capsulatum G186AR]